jgi:hypothetical protein
VTSQPSLSWLVRPHKPCLYGPSPSNLQPIVWQFPCKIFWSGDCFSPPCSLLSSFKVELAWHFCHIPKYSQSGTHTLEDRKDFTWWVQKHLWPFTGKSARKIPLNLGEATSFSQLHLSSCGRVFPYVDAKCHTVRTRGCFLGFCVPNFNKTSKRTRWLARAWKWLYEFTSCLQRTSLWSEKYTGTYML